MKNIFLVIACIFVSTSYCEPLDVEARAYKPLAPDVTLEIGGGVAVELGTIPDSWLVVGPIIGGHKFFIDAIYMRGQTALGASISMRKADVDNGIRLWGTVWKEDAFEWSAGICAGWPINISF